MSSRTGRILLILAVLVVSIAVVALARGAADAPAISDTAVIESYTRLAATGKLLVGAYSRFQWHHPGPLYFYLLAPFYVASGEKTAGLSAGAVVLATASIWLMGVVLIRRQPRLAVLGGLGLALFAWRAAEAAASPWNPHVPVLPTAALLIAAADVVAGTFGMLPVVALLAGVAGQAHVALVPCVLAISTVAAGRVIAGAMQHEEAARRARRSLAITALVVAATWALPIYEQLTGVPRGNLTELWRYFAGQPHAGQPFPVALSAWADMLVGIVRPDFYPAHGWPFIESPVRWAEALALLALSAVAVRVYDARRRRQSFDCALAALLLVASGVALWSTTRIDERIFDHDVFWMSAVGLLVLTVAADAAIAVTARLDVPPRAGAAVVILLLVLASVAPVRQLRTIVSQSFAPPPEARIAGQLASDLEGYMTREHVARPLIRIDQDAWPFAAGAILGLQKRDRMVAVEEDWVVMFTPAFRVDGSEDAVIVLAAPAGHLRLKDRGARLISAHEPVYAYVE